ncbi:MAG: sensor histidine kinase [Acidimicrobiales bacterium]
MRRATGSTQLRSAVRVAAVATVLIAVLYVVVAAAVDVLVARRVLWEVDQRLSDHLAVVANLADPVANRSLPDDVGTDTAPVYGWWVSPSHAVTGLTVGEPPLPRDAADSLRTPLSITSGGSTYRFTATRFRGGLLLAAQNTSGPSHIDSVLLLGEVVIGPPLVVAVFGGVFLIGFRSAAPVESARRRLQELTADASHELRTPLTVIEAEIELARSAPPDPAADREALDHVARESRRLKVIVEDLLWLARADAAPPPPPGARADLVDAAAAGTSRFAAVATARGVALTSQLDESPAWVDAAPDWIERLIGTLLDNACRYSQTEVRVFAGTTGTRVTLRVEDDGPGIAPPLRPTLFDRFRRATDQPGGAGLGRAIADSGVRTTGGRWRVDDSPLGGALMEISWRPGSAPPVLAEVASPTLSE